MGDALHRYHWEKIEEMLERAENFKTWRCNVGPFREIYHAQKHSLVQLPSSYVLATHNLQKLKNAGEQPPMQKPTCRNATSVACVPIVMKADVGLVK